MEFVPVNRGFPSAQRRAAFSIVPAEQPDPLREAGRKPEDTPRLAVKVEPARAHSAITITAASPAAIRRAALPASAARAAAALAEEDTLAAEATVAAGVAN